MTREHLPAFLDQWTFGDGDAPPLYSLNRDEAVPPVIAAQWLYTPDFAEYRGGVFRVVQPVGLTDRRRALIDARLEDFDGNISQVEALMNMFDVDGFFGSCDLDPYADDLDDLVDTLARTWKALLTTEIPDRTFTVWAKHDEPDYGPQVSFYQPSPSFTPNGGFVV